MTNQLFSRFMRRVRRLAHRLRGVLADQPAQESETRPRDVDGSVFRPREPAARPAQPSDPSRDTPSARRSDADDAPR